MSHTITTTFASTDLTLDAEGAIYVASQKILILSDLHFGKGSFLTTHNNLLPHYDTLGTVQRAETLIAHYAPDKVVSLGDGFHDKAAHQRMSKDAVQLINQLCESVASWLWVLGNHDPSIAACFAGDSVAHYDAEGIRLTHEPDPTDIPQIIGHFHPKTHCKMVRSRIRGKCFVQSDRYILMPSFGSYTGGLDTSHAAITRYIPEAQQRKYFMHNQRIWALPYSSFNF